MPRKTPTDTMLALTKNLIDLFSMPFHEMGGAVLTGDAEEAERHLKSLPGDLIDLETFVNHYHLEDFLKGPRSVVPWCPGCHPVALLCTSSMSCSEL